METRPPNALLMISRRIGLSRNPMYRVTDRIEGVVLVLAIVWALLAVPVAATVGTLAYEASVENARIVARSLHKVTATVTVAKPGRQTADVEWTAENGRPDKGVVPGGYHRVGDRVTVWLDSSGLRADPPMSHKDSVGEGVSGGIFALLVLEAIGLILYGGLRGIVRRRNLARWEREWDRVGTEWQY